MPPKGPPRKKRRTAAPSARPSASSMESSTITSNPAADLSAQIKSIVTEVIPAVIPAVTEGVITTLTQMGIIPNKTISKESPSSPSADDHTQHTIDDNNDTVLNTPTVMGESAGPGFLSDLADTSGNTPCSKSISLVHPLDLGIDPKIKGKIWANQFVDLYQLLPNKKGQKIELMDNGDGLLTCKKTNSGSIRTFEKWLEAFHIFVAIYSSKYPKDTPSLMKHGTFVQRLSKQSGDEAALYYDENFRMWRQDNPEYLPWGHINTEL